MEVFIREYRKLWIVGLNLEQCHLDKLIIFEIKAIQHIELKNFYTQLILLSNDLIKPEVGLELCM
jgi:hypothetical protein